MLVYFILLKVKEHVWFSYLILSVNPCFNRSLWSVSSSENFLDWELWLSISLSVIYVRPTINHGVKMSICDAQFDKYNLHGLKSMLYSIHVKMWRPCLTLLWDFALLSAMRMTCSSCSLLIFILRSRMGGVSWNKIYFSFGLMTVTFPCVRIA